MIMLYSCLFVVFLSVSSTTSAFAAFPDTLASWYRDSIQVLHGTGILDGYEDGFFRPRNPINRAEMLKIVMIATNTTAIGDPTTRCFPDVDPEAWYAPHICRAKRLSIANGHSDGLFRPGDAVTVHEGIAFLLRALKVTLDDRRTNKWFKPYENYADTTDIVLDHSYTDATNLLRGQTAQLVTNALASKADRTSVNTHSAGCGLKTPSIPPAEVVAAGTTRSIITSIPSGYSNQRPYGLIVAFHGRTTPNDGVRRYMGLEGRQSWRRGSSYTQNDFIVVYPAGIALDNGTFSWSGEENVELFDRIITTMADQYCIDRDKIFVTGHSLGAWFAHKIACLRGDVIRGMAAVAGPGFKTTCTGPAATLILHNPADQLVALSSGERARDIREEANACSTGDLTLVDYGMNCSQPRECRIGNTVRFCRYTGEVYGSAHSWPNNGGKMILDFFRGL